MSIQDPSETVVPSCLAWFVVSTSGVQSRVAGLV